MKHSSILLIERTARGRFHKLGIYGSVRVWANAWYVFRGKQSRGGRGRRAAVDVLGVADFFVFSMDLYFHIRARVHDRWLRETLSSQRRPSEGTPTASQSSHRDLAPTYPHQVRRLLCSHLRNIASSVDQ